MFGNLSYRIKRLAIAAGTIVVMLTLAAMFAESARSNTSCSSTSDACGCSWNVTTTMVPSDPETCPGGHLIKVIITITCASGTCDNTDAPAYRCSTESVAVRKGCGGHTYTANPTSGSSWGAINGGTGDCTKLSVTCE